MVNRNYSLTTLLLLVLVGAVIASVVTAGITGNVIKLKEDKKGKHEVYTVNETYSKAQVDGLLSNVNAVACDGDDVCEVAKTVSTPKGSTSNLILTSDTRKVAIDGYLLLLESSIIPTSGSSNSYYLCIDGISKKVYSNLKPCV